jgi:transcriptional regulator NrdR family protein
MVCIYCGHDTEVTNSRSKTRNASVWRRRACKSCVAQFTTIELPDYTTAISVESSDNTKLRAFSRDELFLSLYKSLGHRKDALSSATALTNTVIGRLLNKKLAKDGSMSTKDLAKTAYEVLKRFDPLAAHTYKAYHQSLLR